MNEGLWSMVMKMALFLMIACLLVFFLVTPFTAEWYILILFILLNTSVFVFIRAVLKRKITKEQIAKEKKHENK